MRSLLKVILIAGVVIGLTVNSFSQTLLENNFEGGKLWLTGNEFVDIELTEKIQKLNNIENSELKGLASKGTDNKDDCNRYITIKTTKKPMPKEDENGNYLNSEWLDIKHSTRFQVGIGLPAFTFNTDTKKIGFLDSSVDVMFGWRFAQKVWIDWTNTNGAYTYVDHNISKWDVSCGIIFNKPQEGNANFGVMFLPWGMTFDSYSFAAGVSYVFPGKVEWEKKDLNFILAFSLNILQ